MLSNDFYDLISDMEVTDHRHYDNINNVENKIKSLDNIYIR